MSLIPPTLTFGARDPPSASSSPAREQYLFLLEFFVHRATGERLAKLNRMFYVPTRVRFGFLSFDDDEDIAVTPVDDTFTPLAGVADEVERFDAGRSVMFAMDSRTVTARDLTLNIKVIVEKKMPENVKPDVTVGRGEIDLTDRFAALRKEMLQCWHTNYPPPKVFEGDVDLVHEGHKVGTVVVYVSVSGFGQSIVTDIESPKVEKKSSTYVFGNMEDEDKPLTYECRKVDSRSLREDEDLTLKRCQMCLPTRHVCSPCGFKGAAEKPRLTLNDLGEGQRSRCLTLDALGEGQNPRSLTFGGQGHGRSSDGPGGECDAALRSILSGKPLVTAWDPRTTPGLKDESRSRALPIQSSRGPAEPCGKAVVLKVSGLLDVDDPDGRRKQPTVTVGRETGCPDVDPEHDVFVLRIGKKGLVGAGEKSDIQLEMRTPKGPTRRPPIRYETREIQTEEESKGGGQKGKAKVNGGKKKKKKK